MRDNKALVHESEFLPPDRIPERLLRKGQYWLDLSCLLGRWCMKAWTVQTHTKRIVLEIGGMGEGVHICFLDAEGKTEEIDFISYVDHPQAYVKRRADEIAAEQNAEFCGWLCYTIEGEPYLEEWEDIPAELFE